MRTWPWPNNNWLGFAFRFTAATIAVAFSLALAS